MKLSKLQELSGFLEKRSVLQHFVDGSEGTLYIGMTGVQNQIVLHRNNGRSSGACGNCYMIETVIPCVFNVDCSAEADSAVVMEVRSAQER